MEILCSMRKSFAQLLFHIAFSLFLSRRLLLPFQRLLQPPLQPSAPVILPQPALSSPDGDATSNQEGLEPEAGETDGDDDGGIGSSAAMTEEEMEDIDQSGLPPLPPAVAARKLEIFEARRREALAGDYMDERVCAAHGEAVTRERSSVTPLTRGFCLRLKSRLAAGEDLPPSLAQQYDASELASEPSLKGAFLLSRGASAAGRGIVTCKPCKSSLRRGRE